MQASREDVRCRHIQAGRERHSCVVYMMGAPWMGKAAWYDSQAKRRARRRNALRQAVIVLVWVLVGCLGARYVAHRLDAPAPEVWA